MSFMSISSTSSTTSRSCSGSSQWSAPITPDYFPDANENPLPNLSSSIKDQEEISSKCTATPTKASVAAAERVARIQAESAGSLTSSSEGHESSSPTIAEYSTALRSTMRKKYEEAYKKMNRDEGKIVMDLSWDDEDPIDRHVELIKAKAEWQAKRNMELKSQSAKASTSQEDQRSTSMPKLKAKAKEETPMLGRPGTSDDGLPPPRPTLLDFKGYSHLSSRSNSSYRDQCEEGETPGSVCSGGSFEGGSSEDWIDMYGRSKSDLLTSQVVPLDSPTIIHRMSQTTISSDASSDTITSRDTIIVTRASVQSAVGRLQVYPEPNDSNLFQPLPTPAPSSSMASGYFAIPTKSAPAPISRTYPSRPSIGVRQKSRTHPYPAAGRRAHSGDLLRVDQTPDEDPGRTDSETMVLRAGLRSQRTRVVTRV